MKTFLMENLNAKDTTLVLSSVIKVIRGWVNYHGISDNKHSVGQFLEKSKYLIYKWFNRRGGKKYVSWESLLKRLKALDYPKKWITKSMFQYY